MLVYVVQCWYSGGTVVVQWWCSGGAVVVQCWYGGGIVVVQCSRWCDRVPFCKIRSCGRSSEKP